MSEPNNRDTIIREPLLSDSVIATGGDMDHPRGLSPYQVRDHYEAARAKDAELIQMLVDALSLPIVSIEASIEHMKQGNEALAAAAAAGFKPTEQP